MGSMNGDEVVQMYVKRVNGSNLLHPELKDFTRQHVEAHTGELVSFDLLPAAMSVVAEPDFDWIVEPGFLKVYVGGGQPLVPGKFLTSNMIELDVVVSGPRRPLSSC
eukprot:NODE_2374_length_481_cov_426.168981_g1950_i0.p1 GENE.NODE_2374_length_481_cov_426.168981_g1950_i0~~NODE_2374_length_481_cov_426.168981_g1950_i0.p1  ORF type:complete len:107 (+),score=7.32 NODE_2374_length_481_cov_426.168981_g1950_i0:29-349(+)